MISPKSVASTLLLMAFCAAAVAPPRAAAAEPKDLLKLMPDDAWGFIIFKSLDTLDKKAGELNKMLNLTLPPPTAMLGSLQLGDTIDTKSPIGIVMLDMNKHAPPGATGPVPNVSAAVVVLVSAKDPKAMLEKLGASEEKDGICQCAIMGMPSFAAVRDKTVILSQSDKTLSSFLKAEKKISDGVADARLAALEQSDLFLSIAVRRALEPYKDLIKMMFAPMMMGAAGPEDMEKGLKFFSEMEALDISISLESDGACLRVLACPQKDSDLEKLMKDNSNTSESLLSVLPNEKYLLAVGQTGGYSEHASKFGNKNPLTEVLRMFQPPGFDEKAAIAIDEEFIKLQKATDASALTVTALPGGGTDGIIGLAIVVETSKPRDYLESWRTVFDKIWKISDDEDFQTMKEFVNHEQDGETLAGNKVDTVRIKTKEIAEQHDVSDEEMKQMEGFLGKDVVVRFGMVGDKHFVLAFGGGKDRYESICKGVDGKGGESLANAAGITTLSKKLPSPRFMECYIAADNIMQFVKTAAKVFDEEEEMAFDVPTINAPVACAAAQVGGITKFELVVPSKLITTVKKVIDDMMLREERAFDEEDMDSEDSEASDESAEDDETEDDEEDLEEE